MPQSRRSIFPKVRKCACLLLAYAAFGLVAYAEKPTPKPTTSTTAVAGQSKVAVSFTGGYDTDPRDHGRPVILIASALDVTADVFRDAFTHVKPAGAGKQPEDAQVRKNKEALMTALSPYGVTNDRLDEVSNYYRYSGSRGQMWKHRPAVATAVVKDGVVTGFEIVDAGAGYSSPPTISVAGFPMLKAAVTLSFSTELKANGGIKSIVVK